MTKLDDFGGKNPANVYCVHCSNLDAVSKSYDEVLTSMTNFVMMSQKLDRTAAEVVAKRIHVKDVSMER
jgi:hypothetical protein